MFKIYILQILTDLLNTYMLFYYYFNKFEKTNFQCYIKR